MQNNINKFVDSLTVRIDELGELADLSKEFEVFSEDEYARFKTLFTRFRDLCDEFQTLSDVTQHAITGQERPDGSMPTDSKMLSIKLASLQPAMLRLTINTHLRLLRVWHDRLTHESEMPLGAQEILKQTLRVINAARSELLRPIHLAALDEESLEAAEEAGRLLKLLLRHAPRMLDFAAGDAIDAQLLRLIEGSALQ